MKKLTIDDIKILHEGQQLKNAIFSRYPSVEAFIADNKLSMYDKSIEMYFRSTKIRSNKFKYNVVKALDKDYHEIVLTPEEQVERFVENIAVDIFNYLEDEDFTVLEAVKKLCIKYNMKLAAASMYRSIGLYYHYHNNDGVAGTEMFKTALNYLEESAIDWELYVKYYFDMGQLYYYSMDYSMAKSTFDCVEDLIQRHNITDKGILFKHHYSYGTLNNARKKYAEARERFQKALEYAADKTEIGRTIMNIGLTYKFQRNFPEVMRYYEEALGYLRDTKFECTVYNNIADFYKCNKDYENAMRYIDKAFALRNDNKHNYMVSFQTYVETLALKNEVPEGLDKFLDLISYFDSNPHILKKFIILGIYCLIKNGKQHEVLMQKLRILVFDLIKKNSKQKSYRSELIQCLGEIDFCKLDADSK